MSYSFKLDGYASTSVLNLCDDLRSDNLIWRVTFAVYASEHKLMYRNN